VTLQACVPTVMVRSVGDISSVERLYAEEQIGYLRGLAGDPAVRFVIIELRREHGTEWQRPALVKATVTFDGRAVRAHADAETMFEAVDMLRVRLQVRIDGLQSP
jgi:ribosome-associated translation inhibitor RaiA